LCDQHFEGNHQVSKNTDKYYKSLQNIIDDYNHRISKLPMLLKREKAKGRKQGGILRSFTGTLMEDMTENIVNSALIHRVGLHPNRIRIDKSKVKIPISSEYSPVEASETFKQKLATVRYKLYFKASVDKHIWIDNKLVCGIECKTYTENSMLKRILVDFQLLRKLNPQMVPFVFQLENFLGGDYGLCQQHCDGSESTHTILSHFPDVPLRIVTLLNGDRSIHTPFYQQKKPLLIENLDLAANRLLDGLGMGNSNTRESSVIKLKNSLEEAFV